MGAQGMVQPTARWPQSRTVVADHELGRGGDIIDLIKFESDYNFGEAWQWAQRFIPGSPLQNAPPLVPAERDAD